MNRTIIEQEGGDAYEAVRAMLNALELDPADIEAMRVEVFHEEGGPGAERGPVEPGDPGGRGDSGGGAYDGEHAPADFEGAVVPDSNVGRAAEALVGAGGWLDHEEVAEAAGLEKQQASRALSGLFRERGLAERRRKDPQPDARGLHFEYRATGETEKALRAGRSRAGGG
jgi:hypothetical protein